ncbi:hypothetical protein BPNPMPFG_007387 (plasmid) [Mesorhizobium sp. AR07]|uniref:hypothetical protein n=1 Tax=Mesorhizobium sp. AR07 TaxID=2865838 RepID=UPI00161CB945|nr:hypothetical protein HB777_37305 [Mesorhizobium loti]UVK49302.1 hypothetical protein BPNPMPFG_007387 [Mesorhizobium sp. AR07]
MVAEHVELALFEQSLGNIEGLNRPFCDRVADAAEKTAGSVLFDVRVDGDTWVQRMAAIGYGETGTAIIVMEKNGHLRCASINGDTALLVAELAAWNASPLSEQARLDHSGTASILLAKLRRSGHFGRL